MDANVIMLKEYQVSKQYQQYYSKNPSYNLNLENVNNVENIKNNVENKMRKGYMKMLSNVIKLL